MRVLCIHRNAPGQFTQLLRKLRADSRYDVVILTQRSNLTLPNTRVILYETKFAQASQKGPTHPTPLEHALSNGEAVAQAAHRLLSEGYSPDIIIGHSGWGEIAFLKDVFPKVPLLGYFEYFYHDTGADVGFLPHDEATFERRIALRNKNLINLAALHAADAGISPTAWQRGLYPELYRGKITQIHDGIDTQLVAPSSKASLTVPSGPLTLSKRDEVLTYVSRNLEEIRGFPTFMRSLPHILAQRPGLHVIIIGGDGEGYRSQHAREKSLREQLIEELSDQLDWSRVHFMGRVPYRTFLAALQISSVHVYLTVPFVLSWSLLEAMAAGCLVVASRTPPVEEVVIDHKNGLLVDFFAHADLANRVVEVLLEPDRYRALRDAARATIRADFDFETICFPAQLALMNRLIGQPVARTP